MGGEVGGEVGVGWYGGGWCPCVDCVVLFVAGSAGEPMLFQITFISGVHNFCNTGNVSYHV